MRNLFFTFLTLFLCLSGAADASVYQSAEQIPNPHTRDVRAYVSNPDGILSGEFCARLNQACRDIEQVSGTQLAIAVIDCIDEQTDPATLTVDLFNLWGVGQKDRNNGVLLLLAMGTHDMQLRTGDGIEPFLTDAQCHYILFSLMAPHLKQGEIEKALIVGVNEISETVCSDEALAYTTFGFRAQDITPYKWNALSLICLLAAIWYILLLFFPDLPERIRRSLEEKNKDWKEQDHRNRRNAFYIGTGGFGGGSSFHGGSFGGGISFGGGAGGKW